MTPAIDLRDDDGRRRLAEALTAAQESSGYSFEQLGEMVRARLGGGRFPTGQTVRTYHRGEVQAKNLNLGIVMALCEIYDLDLEEVSPALADRVRAVRDLLIRSMR